MSIFSLSPLSGSSHILGQTGASVVSDSGISHSHSHVWGGRLCLTPEQLGRIYSRLCLLELNISIVCVMQILPQAVCTRYGLTVGATLAPLVRLLLMLFFPISYPISKVSSFMRLHSDYCVCSIWNTVYFWQVGYVVWVSNFYDIWNLGSWLVVG